MSQKFGRLALHMWTIDTTPLATALDAAKKAGYDAVELRRTEYETMLRHGHEQSRRCSTSSRRAVFPVACLESNTDGCSPQVRRASAFSRSFGNLRNAVALGCDTLMSAPGQVNGPIKDAIRYLKDAGDIAAEYKLKLAIEYNSQHDVLDSRRALRVDRGRQQPNCGY